MNSPDLQRSALRGGAFGLVVALVLGGAVLNGALADTPSGWDKVEPVPFFDGLLVFLLLPIGCALVITLLALLPSFASKNKDA